MPKVGKRESGYDEKGKREGKAYAKKTDGRMKTPKSRGRGSRGHRV